MAQYFEVTLKDINLRVVTNPDKSTKIFSPLTKKGEVIYYGRSPHGFVLDSGLSQLNGLPEADWLFPTKVDKIIADQSKIRKTKKQNFKL